MQDSNTTQTEIMDVPAICVSIDTMGKYMHARGFIDGACWRQYPILARNYGN